MFLFDDQSRIEESRPHRYLVSGVRFQLPYPLPLVAPDPGGPALVQVAVISAPLALPPISEAPAFAGMGMWVGPDRVMFSIGSLGRALVDRVSGVTLDFDPEISPHVLVQYFCGNIVSAVLHLSKVLPLHASCLVHPGTGRAIAIAAFRGTGKSTLAAILRERGWRPLADDVTAVAPAVDGVVHAWPGPPRFRLSPESMAAAGLPVGTRVVLAASGKSLVEDGGAPWQVTPVPLAAVVEVVDGTEECPQVRRCAPHVSASMVSGHTFRRRLIGPLGLVADHAALCLELTRQVPVFRLARRRELAQLGILADTVEELAAKLPR